MPRDAASSPKDVKPTITSVPGSRRAWVTDAETSCHSLQTDLCRFAFVASRWCPSHALRSQSGDSERGGPWWEAKIELEVQSELAQPLEAIQPSFLGSTASSGRSSTYLMPA
jgi:hypothetical protein